MKKMTSCETCTWKSQNNFYYCENCGAYSLTKPLTYVEEENIENPIEQKTITEEKCIHNYICLKGRCHNIGKGKYKAYKCEYCGKFYKSDKK